MAERIETPAYTIDLGVTQSMIGDFQQCRQACRNRLDGWETPSSRRALDFGTMWHKADELWRTDCKARSMKPEDAEAWWATFGETWMAEQIGLGKPPDDVSEDIAMASALWPVYIAKWYAADTQRDWYELERVFDVPWRGYRLRGKRDAMFRLPHGKGWHYWLYETKTKGQIDEEDIKATLMYDFQNLDYCLAAHIEQGITISGVLYNVIRRPGQKNTRGLPDLVAKIRKAAEAEPDYFFKRFEVTYPPEVIKDFEDNQLKPRLDEFRAWLDGKMATVRNERACIGRYNCEFISACSAKSMAGYVRTRQLFSELLGD
jgi:hypothetical protein